MREIKFRAWDNHGLMVEVYGIDESSIYWKNPDFDESKDFYGSRKPATLRDARSAWILMQYTGLKDSNGVEIYEGDIVDFNDGYGLSGHPKVVEFKTGGFTNCYSYDTGCATTAYPEVIGNIYENPEILN